MRTAGGAAAGLMGCEENICTKEGSRTSVFDEVVVVTDQNADPDAQWRVDHRVAIAALYVLVLEGVQFAMPSERPVRLAEDVGVEQPAIVGALDHAYADGHVELVGERHRFHNGIALRNGFGERVELLPTQVAHMPVAGDAH